VPPGPLLRAKESGELPVPMAVIGCTEDIIAIGIDALSGRW
jgi:hypothetical protein